MLIDHAVFFAVFLEVALSLAAVNRLSSVREKREVPVLVLPLTGADRLGSLLCGRANSHSSTNGSSKGRGWRSRPLLEVQCSSKEVISHLTN